MRDKPSSGKHAYELPLAVIRTSPHNPRKHFDQAELAELAETIKTHGILQALIVRPVDGDAYEVVAGERRYRAARLAGLKTVPVSIRELDDVAALEIMVIENDQRKDLNPIERANGYLKLIDKGRTVEDLAAKVGRSKAFIYGALKVLQLPAAGRRAVEKGDIGFEAAVLIARIPAAAGRERAVAEVLAGGEPMSFRQTRDFIKKEFMVELKNAPFSVTDKTLSKAGACVTCPKMAGNNRAEFPEARADVCTDPQCYQEKVRIHTERVTARTAKAAPSSPEASGPGSTSGTAAAGTGHAGKDDVLDLLKKRGNTTPAPARTAFDTEHVAQIKMYLDAVRALHKAHDESEELDDYLDAYEQVLEGRD